MDDTFLFIVIFLGIVAIILISVLGEIYLKAKDCGLEYGDLD